MTLAAATALPAAGQLGEAAAATPRTLLITPTSFDFGEVFAGETSGEQEVVVTNVSAAAVTLSTVSVGAPTNAQFAPSGTGCTVGTVLAAGASCAVGYTFSPAAPVGAPVTATSTLVVNGQTVQVGLAGVGLAPFLVTPTGLDFGPLVAEQVVPSQRVYVVNVSTRTRPVQVTTTVGAPFAASPPINETLLPGGLVWVDMAFTPGDYGDFTDTATVDVNGWSSPVTVSGSAVRGIGSAVQLTPTGVDFGPEFVGYFTPSDGGTLSVFGDGSYGITSIEGPTTTAFQAVGDCTAGMELSFDTQTSCSLRYVFVPSTPGPVSDQVVVTVAQGTTSFEVTLHLRGTGRRAFLVTPVALDFGDITGGVPTPTQRVYVANVTTLTQPQVADDLVLGAGYSPPLTVTARNIAAPPFAQTTDCVDLATTPGDLCTIDYSLTPTGPGAVTATVHGTLEYGAPPPTLGELVAGQPVPGGTSTQGFTVVLTAGSAADVTPTISVAVTPAAASTGWYNLATGAPTVTFTCAEPEGGSGIASCTPPTTLASSPNAQTVTGAAVDNAGNRATATSPPLLVDLVAPAIACPATPTFVVGTTAVVTANVTDADSGPAAATVSGTAVTSALGSSTVTLTASDVAGNTATATCPYAVASGLPPTGGTPLGTIALAAALLALGGLLMAAGRRTVRS